MLALFKNKKFIGYSEEFSSENPLNIEVKEVPDEYSDISKFTWFGDMESGNFIDVKTAFILKKQNEVNEKIKEKYSIQHQLINIMNQLNLISEKHNIYDISFKDMIKDIKKICSN